MQKSEKEKLVQKLRRAADAQRKAYSGNVYHDGIAQGLDNAAGILGKIRCVDAVEVVRCKDCIHRPVMVWSEVYDDFDVLAPEVDGKEDWRCPCLVEDDPYYSWSPNDNWFCGNGERREADEH